MDIGNCLEELMRTQKWKRTGLIGLLIIDYEEIESGLETEVSLIKNRLCITHRIISRTTVTQVSRSLFNLTKTHFQSLEKKPWEGEFTLRSDP